MRQYDSAALPKSHFPGYAPGGGLIPDLKSAALASSDRELRRLFSQQAFLSETGERLRSFANIVIKRTFDVLFAFCTLPFLLLAVAAIGIAIRLDSPGPALLMQERMGKNKQRFKCIKFRTMYTNGDAILKQHLAKDRVAAEEWCKYKKLKQCDPRVTRVGSFLRKTSLDELPQIFNILNGEMSWFGPRPYLPDEEPDMAGYSEVILLTTPGITGLWQVAGRNDLVFNDRLKLDAWYVLNWSLWLDVVIFFRTIKVVLKREGAY